MQIDSLPDLGSITAFLNDPVRLGLVLSAVAALAAVFALVFVLRQGAARARELSHLRLLAEQALAGTRAEAETTRAELRSAGTATIERLVGRPPSGNPNYSGDAPDPGSSSAPWRVYNIGNNNPVELLEVVRLLEEKLGKKAIRELVPMQPGDVPATFANVDDLMRDVDFKPATPIADGIGRFIDWYRSYHGLI